MSSVIRGNDNFDSAVSGLKLMTAQNSTSGTYIDLVGIPSWAKRITVMFNGVSTNGSSNIAIRLGSGSIQTSGYSGSASAIGSSVTTVALSTCFLFTSSHAANILSGSIEIVRIDYNTYVTNGLVSSSTNTVSFLTVGAVTLSGVLDIIRITTINGTDTFDAGIINVMYEG